MVYKDNDSDGVYEFPGDTPYSGITVNLSGGDGFAITTTTDISGTFEFEAVLSGQITVTVDANSLEPGWFSQIPYQTLVVEGDSNYTDIDFPIQPPSGVVAGEVYVDWDGDDLYDDFVDTAIENIPVRLTQISNNTIFTATSDSNGDYLFEGLAGDEYSIMVPEDYLPPGYTSNTAADFSLNNGGSHLVDFPLRVNKINGFVYKDINANDTYDDGTDSVYANAVVNLFTQGNTVITTTTNTRGEYEFRALAPGIYTATIQEESLEAGWYSPREYGSIAIYDDSNYQGLDFPIQLPATTIAGIVFADLNDDGVLNPDIEAKLAGVAVTLHDEVNGESYLAITDEHGSFAFENLTPGQYQYDLSVDSLPAGHRNTTTGEFTLMRGAVIEIDFPLKVNSISGVVFRDENNDGEFDSMMEAGYSDVIVGLYSSDGVLVLSAVTDQEGMYVFRGIPSDLYTLEVVEDTLEEDWFSTLISRSQSISESSNVTNQNFPIQYSPPPPPSETLIYVFMPITIAQGP
jgi:hypothetical protein